MSGTGEPGLTHVRPEVGGNHASRQVAASLSRVRYDLFVFFRLQSRFSLLQ